MKLLTHILPSTFSERIIFALTILAYALLIFDMSSCKKTETPDLPEQTIPVAKTYEVQVRDTQGAAQQGVTVKLYQSEDDLLNDTLEFVTLITNENGIAFSEDSLPSMLFCKAEKGNMTNEFLDMSYHATELENSLIYEVTITTPTKTQLLCGHGSKDWLMTEYTINGASQGYEVISVLNSDSTWTDSNDRSGSWYFLNSETQIFYDYDGSGLQVTFDVVELTKDYVNFSANEWGMQIEMEMVAL